MEKVNTLELDEVELVIIKHSLQATINAVEVMLKRTGISDRDKRMLKNSKERREALLKTIEDCE